MIYKQLGRTDLNVSLLCLGSMTWGTQNTAAEGHAQIDMALDHGINFIDNAEMYPTNPLSKETQGDTERVIGQWVEKSGRRDEDKREDDRASKRSRTVPRVKSKNGPSGGREIPSRNFHNFPSSPPRMCPTCFGILQ